jgi:hypothetical protein
MYLTLVHFGTAVAVIAAATTLCAMGKIDASAVTALYGAAIGLVGGSGASFASVLRNGKAAADG